MTSDEGRRPEGAPERSPKAVRRCPSGVDGNGPEALFRSAQDRDRRATIARRAAGSGGPANECLHRQANRGSTAGDHHRCQLELDGYTAPVTMVARSALPTFRSRALLLDLPLLLPLPRAQLGQLLLIAQVPLQLSLMLLTQPRVLLPHGGNEVFQFAVEVVL